MTFKKIIFLFLLAFITLPVVSYAQERYVKAVDEAKKDPSFLAFRTKLIAAVKKKDFKYILSIIDKNIKNGFGGDDGIEEFEEWWKIDDPKSEFWKTFLPVITNGGRFVKEEGTTSFYAPYTFISFPDDLSAFDHNVIFGKNVNLRREPNFKAPVVAVLSYNIVQVKISIEDGERAGYYKWHYVETLGGKKGFVKAEYARSPIDHRACFEKIKGKWKMTAFISGD